MRFPCVVLTAVSLAGCPPAPRLSTPQGVAVETLPILRGLGLKAGVDGYLVPSVKVRPAQASRALAIFPIEHRGQLVTQVRCAGTAAGPQLSELLCRGDDFELTLRREDDGRLTGTFERKEVLLRLDSIAASPAGPTAAVAGFDLHRGARWEAAFECQWGGSAYLSRSLGPEERTAVALVAVAVNALSDWMALGGAAPR